MTDPSTHQLVDLLRDAVEHRTALLPPPPSAERVRRVAVRRRRIGAASVLGAAAVAAGGATLLGGVDPLRGPALTAGGPSPAGSPGVSGVPGPPSPGSTSRSSPPEADPSAPATSAQEARDRAERIIDGVVVPPGATRSARSPIEVLVDPPAGGYLVTASRFWTVKGTLTSVGAFFTTHHQNGTASVAEGESSGPEAGDRIRSFHYDNLGITIMEEHSGTVAIRADATVLWAPARSAADRIPTDVRSVEVTAVTTTSPERVLSQRTVTGTDARRLVDLVNTLDRDTRPTHPCPPSLVTERLVLHTGGGDYTVQSGSCDRVALTPADGGSVDLVGSRALTDAVHTILGPLPTASS